MSDEPKTPTKVWTDTEKVAFLFQIIAAQGDKIPWDALTIPEGRTRKAASVMIDREKRKIKDAKAAASNGEAGGSSASPYATTPSRGKRKPKAVDGDDEANTPPAKKAKTPRKKKETASTVTAANEEDAEAEADSPAAADVKEEGDAYD